MDGNHPKLQHTSASRKSTSLICTTHPAKNVEGVPGHDLANSWEAFRLQGAVGSLRQRQKPSSSEGNDAGSGRSGITPTYQEYHSEQLEAAQTQIALRFHQIIGSSVISLKSLMGDVYLVNVSMCRSFITRYRHSQARSIR